MKRIGYHIKNLGGKRAEIRIRGIIGISNKSGEDWFGTYEGQGGTVREFEEEIRALGPVDEIDLYISSEGGDVATGLAMHSILQRHQARVTAYVDGYAYSIATVVLMAADEIRMPSNALLMIHNASTWAGGDYRAFERTAEALKTHNQAIRRAYAQKSGRDETQFIGLMDATTYMDAITAKELGLVDVVTDEVALANLSLSPRFLASEDYARMPQRYAAMFDKAAGGKPQATPPPPIPMNKVILALASLLGVTLKGDETEDQAVQLISNHKPAPAKAELNLGDPETNQLFTNAVSAGISAALPGAVEKETQVLKDRITALEALMKNGAVGAAGAGQPVPTPSPQNQAKVLAFADFEKLPHAERSEFFRQGGKIED